MSDTATVEIERDVIDAAERRAAEQGLTVAAYITLLLRRSFERAAGAEGVLVYDHVGNGDDVLIDREVHEDDEIYSRRSKLYNHLFSRG